MIYFTERCTKTIKCNNHPEANKKAKIQTINKNNTPTSKLENSKIKNPESKKVKKTRKATNGKNKLKKNVGIQINTEDSLTNTIIMNKNGDQIFQDKYRKIRYIILIFFRR